MESTHKPPRTKMGLFRQKQIQQSSTERIPLLKNEDTHSMKIPRFQNQLVKSSKKTSVPKKSEPIQKNAMGQKIVTLQRGFLRNEFSSSTSINESSLSHEASIDSLEHSEPRRKELVAGFLLAIFGAGFMYGLTGILVRLADQNGIGAAETLFVRSVFQTVTFGALICVKQKAFRPPKGKLRTTFCIAAVYAVATITSFYAFNVIPPGNAITTRGATRTIFCIILAFLINREKVSSVDIVAIFACIAGIACILSSSILTNGGKSADPTEVGSNPLLQNIYGYVLIISAGITRSFGMVLVRKLKGDLHSFVVVFYHSSLTFLITFALLFYHPMKWPPTKEGVGYAAAICLSSSVATFSSNSAVQLIHPALVSMGQNMDMIVSIALCYAIFLLPPSFLELFGAILILISVTGIAWFRWRKSKDDVKKSLLSNDKN